MATKKSSKKPAITPTLKTAAGDIRDLAGIEGPLWNEESAAGDRHA